LIGLLGTVLGVIDAFVGIAAKGSGNIGAVAPGVAEALIATAAALSVAIPAVFAYNIFAARLNRIDEELESGVGADRVDGERGIPDDHHTSYGPSELRLMALGADVGATVFS
jgi:hypothetical protein